MATYILLLYSAIAGVMMLLYMNSQFIFDTMTGQTFGSVIDFTERLILISSIGLVSIYFTYVPIYLLLDSAPFLFSKEIDAGLLAVSALSTPLFIKKYALLS